MLALLPGAQNLGSFGFLPLIIIWNQSLTKIRAHRWVLSSASLHHLVNKLFRFRSLPINFHREAFFFKPCRMVTLVWSVLHDEMRRWRRMRRFISGQRVKARQKAKSKNCGAIRSVLWRKVEPRCKNQGGNSDRQKLDTRHRPTLRRRAGWTRPGQ
jgi:hypothetical protein